MHIRLLHIYNYVYIIIYIHIHHLYSCLISSSLAAAQSFCTLLMSSCSFSSLAMRCAPSTKTPVTRFSITSVAKAM